MIGKNFIARELTKSILTSNQNTIVCVAPSGSGKTSLMAEVYHQCVQEKVWLECVVEDAVNIHELLKAFHRQISTESPSPQVRELAQQIVDAMFYKADSVIFVDKCEHLVRDQSSWKLLAEVLAMIDTNHTIILISKVGLKTDQLLERGSIHQVSGQDLAFSLTEVSAYLAIHPSELSAEEVHKKSAGLAYLLAFASSNKDGFEARFEKLERNLQTLAYRLSVASHWNDSLLSDLDIEAPANWKHNLLVSQLPIGYIEEAEDLTLVPHERLLDWLGQRLPEGILDPKAIANYYRQKNRHLEAFAVWRRTGFEEDAKSSMSMHIMDCLDAENWQLLAQLPNNYRLADVRPQFYGKIALALEIMGDPRADEWWRAAGTPETAIGASFEAYLNRCEWFGHFDKMIELCALGLERIDKETMNEARRAQFYSFAFLGHLYLGQVADAERELGLHMAINHDKNSQDYLWHYIYSTYYHGMLELQKGSLRNAERYYSEALHLAQQSQHDNLVYIKGQFFLLQLLKNNQQYCFLQQPVMLKTAHNFDHKWAYDLSHTLSLHFFIQKQADLAQSESKRSLGRSNLLARPDYHFYDLQMKLCTGDLSAGAFERQLQGMVGQNSMLTRSTKYRVSQTLLLQQKRFHDTLKGCKARPDASNALGIVDSVLIEAEARLALSHSGSLDGLKSYPDYDWASLMEPFRLLYPRVFNALQQQLNPTRHRAVLDLVVLNDLQVKYNELSQPTKSLDYFELLLFLHLNGSANLDQLEDMFFADKPKNISNVLKRTRDYLARITQLDAVFTIVENNKKYAFSNHFDVKSDYQQLTQTSSLKNALEVMKKPILETLRIKEWFIPFYEKAMLHMNHLLKEELKITHDVAEAEQLILSCVARFPDSYELLETSIEVLKKKGMQSVLVQSKYNEMQRALA
jgi:hypothetical protein